MSPEKVFRAERKATRAALRKAGAFIRTNARRKQLRRRKRASQPGQPPSVHSKHAYANLKNIRFALDSKETSVIVGPLKFSRQSRVVPISTTVPGVLEEGGTAVLTRKRKSGRTTRRVITIAKRPFMAPAFKQEMPNFPALWKGKIK